ncbi:MAG: toast rack family protein [Chloroflexota bacterium]|nr:toast rack family protein [Chloroflexota bacterium]
MKAGGGKATLMWPLFGLMLVLALAGCGAESTVGAIQTARDSIEHGTATAAGVRIDIATGQLDLADGTNKLMEATFQYNVPGWRPKINYDVNRTPGTLSIVQPVDRNNLPALNGSTVNDWEIRLGNQVPLDLDLRLGLGDARIDFSNLKISGLRMDLGAGNVEADLGGNYRSNVDARITGGLGKLTLKLGDRMATRVTVTGGLGKVTAHGLSRDGEAYTNGIQSRYGLDVMIESGVGEITLDGR